MAAAVMVLPSPRIVGGAETAAHAYPFVVSLQQYGSHVCGASLVAATWALTATHCVSESHVAVLSVSVFRHDISLSAEADEPGRVERAERVRREMNKNE